MVYKVDIKTSARVEFQDITKRIDEIIASSDVRSGLCHIFVPHTTAGVTVNEHADPAVIEDITAQLDKIVPGHQNYRHAEGNSPAHIKATLTGNFQTFFVEEGELVLGTWQGIFFCEFDGPRNRHVLVKLTADRT